MERGRLTRLAELTVDHREFAEDSLVAVAALPAVVGRNDQIAGRIHRARIDDVFGPLVAVVAEHRGLNVLLVELHAALLPLFLP